MRNSKMVFTEMTARRLVEVGTQLKLTSKQVTRRGVHETPAGCHVTATVDTSISATSTEIVVTSVYTDRKFVCTSPLSKSGDTFSAGQKVLIQMNAETLRYEIIQAACN